MIEDIYTQLNRINLVKTQYEFSEKWLGKSKSYFSVLRSTQRDAAITVYLRLSKRLASQIRSMADHNTYTFLHGTTFDHSAVLRSTIQKIELHIAARL